MKIQKMNGNSFLPQNELAEQLKKDFPEIISEDKIDFKKLRAALGQNVDLGERYGLTWKGKSEVFRAIQESTTKTLKPNRGESVDFDTTDNHFIEGDNLEALKVLQKSYYGKVKMIYIDPPYNTGNDFVYNDKFSQSREEYEQEAGIRDEEGNIKEVSGLRKNSKDGGNFHSNWLNMMYPRLYLARNLLRQDGVIFISIDDNEVHNLRMIMNEIFGEENFVGSIAWKKTSGDNAPSFAFTHDTILIFGKGSDELPRHLITDTARQQYKNPDNDSRGDWAESDYRSKWTKNERPNLYYAIINPNTGEEIYPDTYSKSPRVWAYSKQSHKKNQNEGLVWWGSDGQSKEPKKKRFLQEHRGINTRSVWLDAGTNDEATKELSVLFPESPSIFDNPKPTKLIKKITNMFDDQAIIIDFFAGSATTAHAILQLNAEDGGNRKWIMVQLPEKTDEDSEARKAGYKTIAEIAKERIRRAAKKIADDNKDRRLDLGFKVFKLDPTNFKIWDSNIKDEKQLQKQLEKMFDVVREDASEEDLLFELMLKSGIEPTVKREKKQEDGKTYWKIDDGSLIICLADEMTEKLFTTILSENSQKIIFLDRSLNNNDQMKTNLLLQAEKENIEVIVL